MKREQRKNKPDKVWMLELEVQIRTNGQRSKKKQSTVRTVKSMDPHSRSSARGNRNMISQKVFLEVLQHMCGQG